MSAWFDPLRERLGRPLPGWAAQRRMAPRPGENRSLVPNDRSGLKPSAVLALLAPRPDGSMSVLLTLRSEGLSTHRGQISFPGGRIEPGEDAPATALRETEEEVGLSPLDIELVGTLSPLFIPPSKSIVEPVLGLAPAELELYPQPDEVTEAFWLPLELLRDPERQKSQTRELLGHPVEVPYWDVHPATPLWGATAMMLAELIALLDD